MNPHFERGRIMRQQGRYEDAASFFIEALKHEPNSSDALSELAICQLNIEGREPDALKTINQAISLDPEQSFSFACKSIILCELNRPKEALEPAQRAVHLEPDNPGGFVALSQACLGTENWPEAEKNARNALALDPDNSTAANFLAMALRLQNKMPENEAEIGRLLSSDPENALSHYNAGWTALQKGDRESADRHFREALRLDPNFDPAREGLIESFRARSPTYRLYLRYTFFMQGFSNRAKWGIIIGLYLAVRLASKALEGFSSLASIALGFVYLLFVLWVWLARGCGNFLILLDRTARFALKKNERLDGLFVGGGLCLGIGLMLVGGLWSDDPLMILGGFLVGGSLPAALTFTNKSRKGRLLFGSIMVYVYLAGIAIFLIESSSTPNETGLADLSTNLLMIAVLGVIGCTWLGNVSSLRNEAEIH